MLPQWKRQNGDKRRRARNHVHNDNHGDARRTTGMQELTKGCYRRISAATMRGRCLPPPTICLIDFFSLPPLVRGTQICIASMCPRRAVPMVQTHAPLAINRACCPAGRDEPSGHMLQLEPPAPRCEPRKAAAIGVFRALLQKAAAFSSSYHFSGVCAGSLSHYWFCCAACYTQAEAAVAGLYTSGGRVRTARLASSGRLTQLRSTQLSQRHGGNGLEIDNIHIF